MPLRAARPEQPHPQDPWDWIVTNNIERSSSGFVYDRICKELGVVIELPTVREVLDGKKSI